MRSRTRLIRITLLFLAVTVNSFGASYDVIAPKNPKPSEKRQPAESEPGTAKPATAFQPDTAAVNPCPDATGWLLSTVPMTTVDGKEENFSKSPETRFLPGDMQKELVNIAAKENISMNELCGKLNNYKDRLAEYSGDPQEYNRQRMLILEEMLDCRKSCGKILNRFAALYTESSRAYFSGIVRFNTGSLRVVNSFRGDKSHGYTTIDNQRQLKAALAKWQKDPSQRIQLDARSSIPGSVDINDRISKVRAEAVRKWLTRQGVPSTQITIKWLGKYGPLINRSVALSYNIEDIFNDYRKSNAKQTTSLIGSQGVEAFYDGLNQSVCIFVLP